MITSSVSIYIIPVLKQVVRNCLVCLMFYSILFSTAVYTPHVYTVSICLAANKIIWNFNHVTELKKKIIKHDMYLNLYLLRK